MVVMEFDDLPSSSTKEPWVEDALECIKLKFVRSVDDIEGAAAYEPEYAHQHFGDAEKIFGYKNPSITIVYSEATMKILPIIKFDKKINEIKEGVKADDIILKLREQLPNEQLNMMVESEDEFRAVLAKEDNFRPFGELVSKFQSDGQEFEMYRVDESSPEFDLYLTRVQTVSLWYIDAVDYTDNSDSKWMHYFLYHATPRSDGQTGKTYALAGYSSLYRFYAYPQHERPRIAHVLLLPQYRKSGMGASLLTRVYKDLQTRKEIKDITVEDPADACIYLRDYVDCVNCLALPEFAPEKLKQGFSPDMYNVANEKFKMNKRQTRRVYEILRLRATDKKDPVALKEYRLDVKRRLEIPMRRNDKDWKKMEQALDTEEINTVASSQLSQEDKYNQLEQLYEHETSAYKKTIERIDLHPTII